MMWLCYFEGESPGTHEPVEVTLTDASLIVETMEQAALAFAGRFPPDRFASATMVSVIAATRQPPVACFCVELRPPRADLTLLGHW